MKSKDVIAAIKKEDPSGEAHMRFGDQGEIFSFEMKEGYYDGPYLYKDDQNRLVLTDKGKKLDVHFEDIETRIWHLKGDLEKIKEQIIIDLHHKRDRDRYWKEVVEKEARECRLAVQRGLEEHTFQVMERILKEGYEITQPANTKIGCHNMMWYQKGPQKKKLCQGDCKVVLTSGFFKHRLDENRNCYVWELNI